MGGVPKAIADGVPGTRVRLKRGVHAMGWRGCATLLDEFGRAIKDGYRNGEAGATVEAVPYQWAVLRDQTPNPEHADAVAEAQRRWAIIYS